jgi:N-carbamoyl-L-amino-acid hydrolase
MFERSEFAPDPAGCEQRKEPRSGPDVGSPSLCLLSLGEARESESAAGPTPGLPRNPTISEEHQMTTATATDIDTIRINGERLWASLMELAKIGATPKGGVCRLTLTDLDKQGRDLVLRWAVDAGMTVTIDKIGNGFMRRAGRNNSLPPIVTGSHIDTQPTGGKFDGNYGVLAGIEVVRTLNDLGIETEAPIEVAFWTNEEGSRFVPVMMGSGVFAKAFTLEHAYAATDTEGKSVKGELERIGYIGDQEPGDHPIGAYFETHIEQGPVLEDNDVTIGVVQGVLGIRWFDCTVTGMEAHAGPTPMALRKDAMQISARIMQEVVACATATSRMAVAPWAWCTCTPTAAT